VKRVELDFGYVHATVAFQKEEQALKWWRQLAKQVVALGDPFFAPALVAPGVSGTPARQRRLGLRLTRAGPVIWLLGSDDFAGGA